MGSIALIKAIDNFDPNLNIKLSTYAIKFIWGTINQYLRDMNPIHYSRKINEASVLLSQNFLNFTNILTQ